MEKSILEMVGGEKHINPHYDIKAESSSCYINEGFTGIERFFNTSEMLRLFNMNKQREQLIKAKEIIAKLYHADECFTYDEEVERFLKEI